MTLFALKAHIESEHGKNKKNASENPDFSQKEDSFEEQLTKEFLYSQRRGRPKETLEVPAIEQIKIFNQDTINTNLPSLQNMDAILKNQIKEQVMDPWKKLLDSYKQKIEGIKETNIRNTAIDNLLGVKQIEGHITEGSGASESTIEKRIELQMLKLKMSNSNKQNISGNAKETTSKVIKN